MNNTEGPNEEMSMPNDAFVRDNAAMPRRSGGQHIKLLLFLAGVYALIFNQAQKNAKYPDNVLERLNSGKLETIEAREPAFINSGFLIARKD